MIESSYIKDGWTCNWLSVSNLINYDKAVVAYKIMNNLCPNSLQGKFTTRSQISAYATRNCQDIDIPKRNLEFSKQCFPYPGAKLWNGIPLDIRNSQWGGGSSSIVKVPGDVPPARVYFFGHLV